MLFPEFNLISFGTGDMARAFTALTVTGTPAVAAATTNRIPLLGQTQPIIVETSTENEIGFQMLTSWAGGESSCGTISIELPQL